MRYISTRGSTEPLQFTDAVMTGLAPDGGLLLPEVIPSVGRMLDELAGMSYVELARAIFSLYVDDIPDSDLSRLVRESYATFDVEDVVVLRPLGDLHVLELFHGPTLAFKDVALQFVGRLFEYILSARGAHLNILGATSGDTGSAAIAGVRGQDNVDIFVMYPRGRISELQEMQMTTVTDENVHCLAVEGSFDDCQSLMKGLFSDLETKRRLHLGAVNSVNWARVLAQIVYYAWASLQLGRAGAPVSFCVPTGNFGNIFAGYLAKCMGFPIGQLILAANDNDILAVFFDTGVYRRGDVHYTVSPAMDIQVASNFERFLFYHFGGDAERLTRFMADFAATGSASVDGPLGAAAFRATSVTEADTLARIRSVYDQHAYVVDPHTAVGLAACDDYITDGPLVCLATAHPAKFPEAVDGAIGKPVAFHERLEGLADLPRRCEVVVADQDVIRAYIEAHASAR